MEIRLLTSQDKPALLNLFANRKYMGVDQRENYFVPDTLDVNDVYFQEFCNTYLSDLKNYRAFGNFENNQVTAMVSFHISMEGPDWYLTQIRSNDFKVLKSIFDQVIDYNEKYGRYKFYTLFNCKHVRSFRKLMFSKKHDERYNSFEEFVVPAKTKCWYAMPWQVLFNRTLLPVDSLVGCTVLKQQYRAKVVIAGSL